MTPIKKCTKCGGEFPATTEYFHRYQQGFYGLSCWCKSCRRTYNRLWRDTRQEKERAYYRQYYLSHIEKKRIYDKKRRAANREKGRENHRRWHAAHPEKNRTYCKQRRDANREKYRERGRQHYAANREKYREYRKQYRVVDAEKIRARNRNRRARKRAALGSFTHADVKLQYQSQQGLCFWCSNPLNGVYHIDHMIPLVRGGTNWPDNIVCACPGCNLSKNDKLPYVEWQPPNPLKPQ